jgi:Protein of unknown function (DUF2752)
MVEAAIRRRHAHLALAAVLSAGAAMAAVLYRFPPTQYGFYPVCPIHRYTGWLCPGCGMTRALAALIHGNLHEALHWNPLIAIVVPGMIAWLAILYHRAVTGREQHWPKLSGVPLCSALAALAIFTVGRNLF